MSAVIAAPAARSRAPALWPNLDHALLGVCLALLALGVVMVGSASISTAERQLGNPFYYLERQALYAVAGLMLGWITLQIRLVHWERTGVLLLIFAYFLLLVVLLPGVGKTVNGSTRWIPLGVFNLQVSEPAKLFVLLYLGGFLVRRTEQVQRQWSGFLVPVGLLGAAAVLLLSEPDFGAAVVMMSTGLAMLFIAGVPLWRYGLLLALCAGGAGLLVVTSPYRLERLTGFLNPWADPFDSGFQLTQSLIAFGRGEWLGVGLGGSVQKLFYLPEAHTDFLFAVLAEELGLVGVWVVALLYAFLIWRAFRIAAGCMRAGKPYAGFISYGIGTWLGLQAFVNMGVNMGLLPTKGLTLPLMSYGGSSLLITCIALALLLRADHELRIASVAARTVRGGGS